MNLGALSIRSGPWSVRIRVGGPADWGDLDDD